MQVDSSPQTPSGGRASGTAASPRERFAAWREATSPLASPSAAAFTPSVFLTTAAKRELSSDPLTDSDAKLFAQWMLATAGPVAAAAFNEPEAPMDPKVQPASFREASPTRPAAVVAAAQRAAGAYSPRRSPDLRSFPLMRMTREEAEALQEEDEEEWLEDSEQGSDEHNVGGAAGTDSDADDVTTYCAGQETPAAVENRRRSSRRSVADLPAAYGDTLSALSKVSVHDDVAIAAVAADGVSPMQMSPSPGVVAAAPSRFAGKVKPQPRNLQLSAQEAAASSPAERVIALMMGPRADGDDDDAEEWQEAADGGQASEAAAMAITPLGKAGAPADDNAAAAAAAMMLMTPIDEVIGMMLSPLQPARDVSPTALSAAEQLPTASQGAGHAGRVSADI